MYYFFPAYVLHLCLSVYTSNLCCPCMIATIPLVTGNKLNCFISASGMLAIIRHCAFVFFCVLFLFLFLHVNKTSSQKKYVTYFLTLFTDYLNLHPLTNTDYKCITWRKKSKYSYFVCSVHTFLNDLLSFTNISNNELINLYSTKY